VLYLRLHFSAQSYLASPLGKLSRSFKFNLIVFPAEQRISSSDRSVITF